MASSREERLKSNHKDVARLRIGYHAHLGWVEGYPLGEQGGALQWQCVPRRGAAATVRVGPMELSRARRALNEIQRDLPTKSADPPEDHVLPPLDRVDAALVRAGAVRRGGLNAVDPWSGLSPRAATIARQVAKNAALVRMAQSIAWAHAVTGDDLAAFRWLDGHGAELGQLAAILPTEHATRLACVLSRLVCDIGDRRVGRVLPLLCNPELYQVPTLEQSGSKEGTWSKESLGAALVSLIESTLLLSSGSRMRALRLAAETAPLQWLRSWQQHWARLESWRGEQKIRTRSVTTAARRTRKPRPKTKAPEPPPDLHARLWTDVILAASAASDEAAQARDLLLRALPDDTQASGVRARMLVILHHTMSGGDAISPAVVRAWAAVLQANPGAFELLNHSNKLSSSALDTRLRHTYIEVLDALPKGVPPRESIDSLLALTALAAAPNWRLVIGVFSRLVELGRAPPWAASAARAAAPALQDITVWRVAPSVVELASSLAGESADTFASVLTPIASCEQIVPKGVRGMLAFLREIGADQSLRDEIIERRLQRVTRWTQAFAVLRPDEVRGISPDAGIQGWQGQYPKPLRGVLSELARLPDGEARALRLLRRALPARDALKRELAHVRAQRSVASSDVLQAREGALVARLRSGTRLRARDIEKLSDKIRRAATRGRAELVDSAIDDALFATLSGHLHCATKPSWWTRDDALAIVAAVGALPATERRLGYELLAARGGPAPWLPWAHPKNAGFLARMSALGVQTAPWLASAPLLSATIAGRVITLALESDPLEILLMGERFSTCLSLNSFNFFSAVVNAADVNKRVLYARTPEGAVLGRCLLALTDQGKILTFEPYSHDRSLEFGELVARAARLLASAMSTHVAPSGPVSPLLASRWYDDGPQDLTGQMAALATGSALRRELATVEPYDAVTLIESHLAPYGLDETTLPRILSLPEVAARPVLAVALAPKLAAAAYVPWATRLACSAIVFAAGETLLAQQVLHAPGLWRWLVAPCPECGFNCHPNLDQSLPTIATVDPYLALKALKRTRPRGVRRWDDEQGNRLLNAAIALRAVGRTAQSRRLLEHGLRGDAAGHLGGAFREQLDQLLSKRA